ncbi:sulfurtransferase [Planococcus sp. CP5-4]|uniref:sulfurtransferase n=1 Tax=unclassified Planococcus (in: firmicutes) TaxID=2662419 RepID=UPI001C2148D4|nr:MULTISPECIES: sulfurtransferase [unclassified Planococcus (in: firmicutes)]MBU9671923.1 sulfurtransferase [Planococcus sp. CP5-4_YE]MBV0907486.1 sulfurtransferase [Planococcus sp. CP5-4_UN]MBW6062653.1 sulfurtransferase [Planococcus sp. CP5-4]
MTVFIETIDTENYRWIDARFDLKDSAWGSESFAAEHVEGAIHWDLENDLSDMASANGRHPMPSKEQLTQLFQQAGLELTDSIVVYDQGGSPYAARAWWLLAYAGFEHAYISRIGFEELKQQGIAISNESPSYPASAVAPEFHDHLLATRKDVQQIVDGKELGVLIDARSAERYAGINEPIDAVAGRIPGARNYDWSQLVSNGAFRIDEEFGGLLQPKEPAVVYCGSGVTAAALYAMLVEKQHEGLKLYVGSYSDWISDEDSVVEIDRNEHPEAADDQTKAVLAKLIEEGYTGEMLMKKFEYEKSLLNDKK